MELECDVCGNDNYLWFDDGIIRCDACHTNVAVKWGGDYDILIKRYNDQPVGP